MAEFGRWDGSQASFCESRGVPVKTFKSWRRRRGLTGGGATGGTGGLLEVVAAAEATPALDRPSSMTGAIARIRWRRSRNLCFRASSRNWPGVWPVRRTMTFAGMPFSFRLFPGHGIQDGGTGHTRNVAVSHSMMFNLCSGHIINLVWY